MRMKEGWCISLESGSLGPWYYHFLFHLHFVLFRFGVSFFFFFGWFLERREDVDGAMLPHKLRGL